MTDTDVTAAAPEVAGPPITDLYRFVERPRRGPKIAEGRSWDTENSDHSPNVGSYGVQAAASMVELAVELLVAGGRDPKERLVRWCAQALLWAADEIQAGVRSDGRVDRMAASHARSRGVLRTVLDLRPFPTGAATDAGVVPPGRADQVHEWHAAATNAGVRLLRMAVDLSGVDWRTAP